MTHATAKKTVNISAHVPMSLAEKLQRVSQFEERAKSYYIKKSLEQFLEQRLEEIEDYLETKKAYEQYENSGTKAKPLDEVFKDVN